MLQMHFMALWIFCSWIEGVKHFFAQREINNPSTSINDYIAFPPARRRLRDRPFP